MKYCAEMTQEIATMLQNGSNRTDACIIAGISYETFTRWMENSEFREAIKKAESKFKNGCISVIIKAMPNSWQAAAWMLERKFWNEFAQHMRQDEGDIEAPKKMAGRAAELLKDLENREIKVHA